MEIILLNEDQIEIDKFNFDPLESYNLKKIRNIPEINENTKKFIENLDYMVCACSTVEKTNDFYISFLNSTFLNFFNFDLNEVKGSNISELISHIDKKGTILKKISDLYNKNEQLTLYVDYKDNQILIYKFKIKIFRLDNFLYIVNHDITKQIEKEVKLKKILHNSIRLEKNFEKIQKISKTSMCYSDDKTNKVVWFSKGYNIFEDNPRNNYDTIANYIIDEDKCIWKENQDKCTPENPEVIFIQRASKDGKKIKYIKNFVAYEFDEKGNRKCHVNFFQDITETIKREEELSNALNKSLVLQDNLNRIQSVSKTAMGYSNDSKHSTWTLEIFDMLEIKPDKNRINDKNLIEKFVVDKDLKVREKAINSLNPNNTDVEFTQQVKTAKGNKKYLKTFIHRDYDSKGNLKNDISFNQDITNIIEYQQQLESTLNDREILLSEVHHRVKNNLQIILSLINLNESYGEDSGTILKNTQDRIYAMALIHEKIYGSKSLSKVNMKEYIESLITSLLDMYNSEIIFHSEIEPIDLNMDYSIPIGLIINELVNNTIKYAFPNSDKGNIFTKFMQKDNKYVLLFKDDGIGLPEDIDLDNITTLGLIVVTSLTLQIGGVITKMDCEGTGFRIEFEKE